jgi:hypothetical protein
MHTEFAKNLRAHDWYFAYSDDHRYWLSGTNEAKVLRDQRLILNCPYDMDTLRKWAYKMIVELFSEEAPGEWYKQPRIYEHVLPTTREDLLTQAKYDEISEWLAQ